MDSPLREASERRGAVLGMVGGWTLARHYGDSAAEYAALRQSAVVVDRADLARIRMHGRDPIRMVQGLITNDLAGSPADRAVYGALLTAKGRMVADLRTLRRPGASGEEVWMDLPREALDGTLEHLSHFVPPMFARFEDVSETAGVIGVYGPRAGDLLTSVFQTAAPELPEDAVLELALGDRSVLGLRTLYTGGPGGWDLWAGTDVLPELWEALLAAGEDIGAKPAGFGTVETARIEAGRPRFGTDLTPETIPQEGYEAIGMIDRAISFSKGCYTGQEVVVRIAHRGRVNRHLRGLRLGDAPVPSPRTPLVNPSSEKEVGWTTSAAVSPALGETVAMAYVRREIPEGTTLRMDGREAVVTDLPFLRNDD